MARDKAYLKAEMIIEEALYSQMNTLDLADLKLTELPESLSRLKQLRKLDLFLNRLMVLPEWIINLTHLQVLDLGSNQLTVLPESLGELTQLQELNLSHNPLTTPLEMLGELRQLQSLNLRNTKIMKLPESLCQLKQLQSLDISRNQLEELPKSLSNLTQLQELDLSDNQLTSLPESLGQLTQLRSLVLSSNKLKTLPGSLVKLSQLKTLVLARNELIELPDSLGNLAELQSLDLSYNQLASLPESLGKLTQLEQLYLLDNPLMALPESLRQFTQLKIWLQHLSKTPKPMPSHLTIFINNKQKAMFLDALNQLTQLQSLDISYNELTTIPEPLGNLAQLNFLNLSNNELTTHLELLGNLTQLKSLNLSTNHLRTLPESFGQLMQLQSLDLSSNNLVDLPPSLPQLEHLKELDISDNPLNLELAAAYEQGLDTVKSYLRAKAIAQITLNEAKLILVGEGEVGKTCLMDALLDNPWQEHDTTHGIEIKQIKVNDPDSGKEITLNGWDFGGQRVYRPTHQLFFSAPAVYLVVWKPREGPQSGFVKEWIKLIKHREPEAKILVVATHGGPGQRQPDIDRQELWDLFGKDTIIDLFHVESKPNIDSKRRGIKELKRIIARVASSLPEMGRSVPKRWQDVRKALAQTEAAYLPLEHVLKLCYLHQMDDDEVRLFVTIEHRLGHLIHYQHDPTLRDIVVLKPNWLATAISFVLDDNATRRSHGLVRLSRLSQLWDDRTRAADSRYPAILHPIFLRLMERFDLSYRVADTSPKSDSDPQSLIAQLVPDIRPENLEYAWPSTPSTGDLQQTQICRIVDAQNGQSASAEGLFYQLIVRLHKYSLGRVDYSDSVHWQRGLMLDDEYNGRALLEHVGNDVRITVRAPYPERFLAMLTSEVKYLVESFWEGLQCDVMVPCIEPCGRSAPGTGLFEVEKLIGSKRKGRPEYPCPVCNDWQNIDHLLRNAPAAQPEAAAVIIAEFAEVKAELAKARQQMSYQGDRMLGRFDRLDDRTRRILSLVDNAYSDLLHVLTDEAKDGPRLFSLVPVKRSVFNPNQWTSDKFHLILWCEHSRLPLPILNGKNSQKGIYELELTREWFKKAAPFLKVMTSTLGLVLPVAAAGAKLVIDKAIYDPLEDYLNFGKEVIDATLSSSQKVRAWTDTGDSFDFPHGTAIRSDGATLRELHALLKAKAPGFGGLVRVMNKRQEFLWVHEKFAGEY